MPCCVTILMVLNKCLALSCVFRHCCKVHWYSVMIKVGLYRKIFYFSRPEQWTANWFFHFSSLEKLFRRGANFAHLFQQVTGLYIMGQNYFVALRPLLGPLKTMVKPASLLIVKCEGEPGGRSRLISAPNLPKFPELNHWPTMLIEII